MACAEDTTAVPCHVGAQRQVATDWLAVYRQTGLKPEYFQSESLSPSVARREGEKETEALAWDRGDETWLPQIVQYHLCGTRRSDQRQRDELSNEARLFATTRRFLEYPCGSDLADLQSPYELGQ